MLQFCFLGCSIYFTNIRCGNVERSQRTSTNSFPWQWFFVCDLIIFRVYLSNSHTLEIFSVVFFKNLLRSKENKCRYDTNIQKQKKTTTIKINGTKNKKFSLFVWLKNSILMFPLIDLKHKKINLKIACRFYLIVLSVTE